MITDNELICSSEAHYLFHRLGMEIDEEASPNTFYVSIFSSSGLEKSERLHYNYNQHVP